MIPAGGKNIIQKLKHVFFLPIIYSLRPFLKKTDIIHFRAPTGFGVLFLPWLFLFWRKKMGKIWRFLDFKDVPLTFKFQDGFYYIFQKMQKSQ